ncbi:hypothetical protein AAVH_39645, partial [Aphelenchoides avenae]
DADGNAVGAPREQSFVVDYPVIHHVLEEKVEPRTSPSTLHPELISFWKRKFKVPDGRQITPSGTVVSDGSTPMSPAVQHRFASKVSNRLDRYGTRDGSRKTVNKGPSKVPHGYSSGYWTPERLNEEIRQVEALVPKEMRTSSRRLERYRFVRRMRRSYSLRVNENAAMEMRTADKLDNLGNRNEKSFVGRVSITLAFDDLRDSTAHQPVAAVHRLEAGHRRAEAGTRQHLVEDLREARGGEQDHGQAEEGPRREDLRAEN